MLAVCISLDSGGNTKRVFSFFRVAATVPEMAVVAVGQPEGMVLCFPDSYYGRIIPTKHDVLMTSSEVARQLVDASRLAVHSTISERRFSIRCQYALWMASCSSRAFASKYSLQY